MSAASLAGECGPEEMSHLTSILQKPEALARADQALGGPSGVDLPLHRVGEGGDQLADLAAIGDFLLRVAEVVLGGYGVHTVVHLVGAAAEHGLKGRRALELDKIVHVLLERQSGWG